MLLLLLLLVVVMDLDMDLVIHLLWAEIVNMLVIQILGF